MTDNEMRRLRERTIARAFIEHMRERGFIAWRTWDGGEEQATKGDTNRTLAAMFNLDEVSVRFVPASLTGGRNAFEGAEHGVLFVMGNDEDIISDWNYSADDADGFNAAVSAFCYEMNAAVVANLRERGTGYAAQADQCAVLAGPWLKGKPRSVLFVGKGGAVRRLGVVEGDNASAVDALLLSQSLSAGRVSLAEVDAYPGGWRREFFIAHA